MTPATVERTEVDEFIYHLSHDVRASVRALRELPGWIESDLQTAKVDVPDTVAECLGLMQIQARRLDRMLLDLLTYSRIGRMQSVAPVQWQAVVAQVIEDLEIPESAPVDADLHAAEVVMGTRDGVTLLTALVSNAVKHGDGAVSGVRIVTYARDGHVVLEVSDRGPGIAPKHRDKVFDLMSTLKPRDEVDGSGLGLPIARKICRTYGGEISLEEPQAGGGCLFRAVLPMPMDFSVFEEGYD